MDGGSRPKMSIICAYTDWVIAVSLRSGMHVAGFFSVALNSGRNGDNWRVIGFLFTMFFKQTELQLIQFPSGFSTLHIAVSCANYCIFLADHCTAALIWSWELRQDSTLLTLSDTMFSISHDKVSHVKLFNNPFPKKTSINLAYVQCKPS